MGGFHRSATGLHRAGGLARRLSLCAAAALGSAYLVGGWVGLAAGIGVAVAAERFLRRQVPVRLRRERAVAGTDLPYAAELLAATLRAGLPTQRAVRLVATSVGGPLGDRLTVAADEWSSGPPAEQTRSGLADVPGGERLAATLRRGVDNGSALAGALGRLAEDLRANRAVRAAAAARRAAVLLVLPLGLCFLPAFLLAGVVPVIVAVLGGVLR